MSSKVITATYAVSTPLFSSGADPDKPELRLPSFKGVLRYWWRALAWSRFQGDLLRIEQEERRVFGSSGSEGQSRVLMRLEIDEPGTELRSGELLAGNSRPGSSGAHPQGLYYLGYGLVHGGGRHAGCVMRGALVPPVRFRVEMLVTRNKISEIAFETLVDALKAIGLLGGMGARSRRGFGSLMLERLTIGDRSGSGDAEVLWRPPGSVEELRSEIARLGAGRASSDQLPEYTAFSARSRVVLLTTSTKDPLRLLDSIGREMMLYRGWGRNGQVAGLPSERRFQDDHDLMLELREPVRAHPRRIAFGLPQNYRFSSLRADERPNRSVRPLGPRGKRLDRRASPLFIHVHMCRSTPVGVLAFLPAKFLPEGARISVNGYQVELERDESKLYQPVEEFLERLLKRSKDRSNTPKTNFAEVAEVKWV